MAAFLLWLVAPAWAHLPHDNVLGLGAPSTLDASAPWVLVYADEGVQLISRSDDGGATWTVTGGDPLVDTLVGVTQLSGGVTVLLSTTRYWYSADGGDSWTAAALPADVDRLWTDGTDLYLGGADGIWRGTPGGTFTQELSGVTVLGFGQGSVAYTATEVYRRGSSGTWSSFGSPASDLASVAHAGSTTYAGTHSGDIWKRTSSGTWTRCTVITRATSSATTYPDIVQLALDGTTLYAAPAWRAPYRSTNACASWSDRSGPPDTTFGGSGGAESVDETWTFLAATGGKVVAAGWVGLYDSADSGVTWNDRQTIPPDYTRDITFSPDFAEDRVIWWAAYAAGPIKTDDGGLSFSGLNHGLSDVNVQRVHVPMDPADADTVFAVVNHAPFVSYDGGENWSAFATTLGTPNVIRVWDTGDEVWALGGGGVTVPHRTEDGGATWTAMDDLDSLMGSSRVGTAERFTTADGDTLHCVVGTAPSRFACSWDDGLTFEEWAYDEVYTSAGEPSAWPPGAATRFLYVDQDGLHYTDDLGGSWTVVQPIPNDPADQLEVAPDGTIFTVTLSGWVLRSFDGGTTWEDLNLRIPGRVYTTAARPDFADQPEVLFGAHDGTWRLVDAVGESPLLERWPDYQRIDDDGAYFRCSGCSAAAFEASADLDGVRPLGAGASAQITFRGERLVIRGDADGVDTVSVAVDGVTVGTIGTAAVSPVGVLHEVTGLPYGVHVVTLTGSGAGGVRIDGVEAFGPYDPMAFTEYDADGDGHDAEEYGGDDCDDADPAVYPGAAETWYDGVDQDCAGDDDFDQDADGDRALAWGGTDCDDTDAGVNPAALEAWYDGVDQDCDGNDDDLDLDGQAAAVVGGPDCDDTDGSIYWGAPEIEGDGIDQDCDGLDPEPDLDGDGHLPVELGGGDCDDTDPSVFPGAYELWYDGVDADCDGGSDYDQDFDGEDAELYGGTDCNDTSAAIGAGVVETWYDGIDANCDGLNDYDQDVDGAVAAAWGGDDCDDLDASVNPAAVEIWYDGVDQDCKGDDDFDQDVDGYPALGWGGTDCDDTDADVNPGAAEVWYDGIDQDCDGAPDDDRDGDGWPAVAAGGTDCNDTSATVNPGATEIWYDGVDQNCDGRNDYDRDGDGYLSAVWGGDDCNDRNRAVRPGATETWYDGVDQNCDGRNDYDRDGDGQTPIAYGGTDCDDTRFRVRVGATEIVGNGIDENCNGSDAS